MEKIDQIINQSDGIVIARGYLGLALDDIEDIVYIQKYITHRCNVEGKPVLLQTQIINSMTTRMRPTRSEVCDIAQAVQDGVDAMILSQETATGKFPVETTRAMS